MLQESKPPSGTDILRPGETLAKNDRLVSKNGRFTIINQSDGNVVLYDTGSNNKALWSTSTYKCYDAVMSLYANGALVVTIDDSEIWTSWIVRFSAALFTLFPGLQDRVMSRQAASARPRHPIEPPSG